MSTYWDIQCVDCNSWAGMQDTNHLDDPLKGLIKHRAVIESIAAIVNDLWEVDFRIGYQQTVPLHWFADHKGHSLALVNEYGETAK